MSRGNAKRTPDETGFKWCKGSIQSTIDQYSKRNIIVIPSSLMKFPITKGIKMI